VPGTHQLESPLYSGVTNYLDWCVKNTGEGNAGPFTVSLFIEDVFDLIYIDTRHYEYLEPGDSIIVEDFPWDCPETGTWRLYLKVEKDLDNPREETNTEDNAAYHTVTFEPAPLLTVSGGPFEIPDIQCDSSSSTPNLPLVGYQIELWDSTPGYNNDSLIDVTYTDQYGYFTFPTVLNQDGEDTPLDIYLLWYPSKEGAWVQDTNYTQDLPQRFATNVAWDVADGNYTYGPFVLNDTVLAGSFYALDRIIDSRNKWLELGMPPPANVRVYIRDFTTSYYRNDTIGLAIRDDDQWDRSIVCHEYGHHLMDGLNVLPNSPGGYHGWDIVLANTPENRRLVASESIANFWSAFVAESEWYDDRRKELLTTKEMCRGHSRDIETGENIWFRPEHSDSSRSYNHFGYGCETSVTGIIWDLWDWPEDDNSAFGADSTWPPTSVDGIGDSMSVDIRTILAVLTDTYKLGRVPDDMAEFAYIWRQDSVFLVNIREMRNVYYEHGVECWCGARGNVSGDLEEVVDITDLQVLVDALFLSLSELACKQEANVADPDNVFFVDITDVQVLIDHLFLTLQPLPECR